MGLRGDVITNLGNAYKGFIVCRILNGIVHHFPVGRHTVNVQKAHHISSTVGKDVVHPLTMRSLLDRVANLQP